MLAQEMNLNTETIRVLQEIDNAFHYPQPFRQLRMLTGIVEEAGEFLGNYHRWSGAARRTDTKQALAAELADVLICVYVAGHAFGLNVAGDVEARRLIPNTVRTYASSEKYNPSDLCRVAKLVSLAAGAVDFYIYSANRGQGRIQLPAMHENLAQIGVHCYNVAKFLSIKLHIEAARKIAILHERGWNDRKNPE